ncbi:cell division transport system permease protein [Sphingomonas vulcanisoli]|uniref:Cell division transport system permease protein n=1 Tax=Sphingomonas vulcanisoli TaxID=1658060 RepID=A0ABX0TMZ9_9SPHN|nr:hypothetical protein [Sphingomonas vulcanisoli]NIJ06887.1 cell division transport system permease protein [Sphingomonas vulcanisoli]
MTGLAPDLLAQRRLLGPLAWVIAAICLIATLASATALTLDHGARSLAGSLAGRATVEVSSDDPVERERHAEAALRLLRGRPEIVAATPVSQAEVARLAEQLGADAEDGLELPTLIDVTLRPGVSADALTAQLLPIPGVRLLPQAQTLAPLAAVLEALDHVALGVALVAAVSALLASGLAAHAALAAHEAAADILHALGATDRQLSRLLERRIGFEALAGAVLGSLMGGGAILFIAAKLQGLDKGQVTGTSLHFGDWAVLAAIPLLLSAAAVAMTRVVVMARLAKAA